MKRSFGVIGGDRRQSELAKLLAADGHCVAAYGLENWDAESEASLERAAAADIVILPLPLCKAEGILSCEKKAIPTQDFFPLLRPDQLILAGQVKSQQQQQAAECGLRLLDYFQREDLTVANAAATAEAAIQVAMEQLRRTLLGMDCLVLGFGRIGKLLCHRLHGLGAHVTAAARNPADLAWIRAYGYQSVETGKLDGQLHTFGTVFNTIPAPVLTKPLLAQLPPDCLCVDLASAQGIDMAAAEKQKLPAVWARALPGRLVPLTAAEIIRDAVYYIILEERGDPA
ncbi:dipicolinate synthase subunit DpsA [Oscillibacter sp.]|uniref:dipicolinate synthase subunit DpsA n=1 Tax=Oscillibacter sp. TaxID=1945593 RepID=UPI002608F145|nr:dipicolinate synthase subunit DpsA [Oscillibacter sp.]MDD3347720.1 dipicolinate synthase subunit DpsA [Oscillibacter sp.]